MIATSGGSAPPAQDQPAVVVDGLVLRYGDLTAVDGASFTAQAGQVTVLLGPNGAGKTSTVEHLEGYRRAAGGRSSVLGLDPLRDHRALTRSVGIMLQSGGIPTAIRPIELLRQYAGFFEDPLRPEELLGTVGLSHRDRTPYRRLSGGEQQRLSLALALVGRPRVVFLDEPTAGVDLEGRDRIRSVITGLRDDGVAVVVTTHDLDEAERIADHIVIMDRGRVVADGTPAELVTPRGDELLRFGTSPSVDVTGLAAALGEPVREETPGEYVAQVAPTPTNVALVANWLAEQQLQLSDLRADRQRLDDVFRRLTSTPQPSTPQQAAETAGTRSRRGRGRRR